MNARPGQVSYLLHELFRDHVDHEHLFENINYQHLLALQLSWSDILKHIDRLSDADGRYFLRNLETPYVHDYISENLAQINLHHKSDVRSLEKALFVLGTLYDSQYDYKEFQSKLTSLEKAIRDNAATNRVAINETVEKLLIHEKPADDIQLKNEIKQLFAIINQTLYDDWQLRGGSRQLLNIKSHFLQELLSEHRRGIPLSLSCLYIIMSNRLGLPVYGVNLPRHFIAKLEISGFELFINADNRGELIERENIPALLEELKLPYNENYLDECNYDTIIRRAIANLILLYKRKGPSGTVRFLEGLSRNLAL